jgi:hypothetical protein
MFIMLAIVYINLPIISLSEQLIGVTEVKSIYAKSIDWTEWEVNKLFPQSSAPTHVELRREIIDNMTVITDVTGESIVLAAHGSIAYMRGAFSADILRYIIDGYVQPIRSDTSDGVPDLKFGATATNALRAVDDYCSQLGIETTAQYSITYYSEEILCEGIEAYKEDHFDHDMSEYEVSEYYVVKRSSSLNNIPLIDTMIIYVDTGEVCPGYGITAVYSNDGLELMTIAGVLDRSTAISKENLEISSNFNAFRWLEDAMKLYPDDTTKTSVNSCTLIYIASDIGDSCYLFPAWAFFGDRGQLTYLFDAVNGEML